RLHVDLFPFRIEPGRLQFVDPTEEFFHEAFDPAITRRLRLPVVRREKGWNRDGGDALALRDQVGIVRRFERGSDIVVREFRTELDRQELEAGVPFALDEGVDRLRRDEDDSSNLTAPQLLHGDGVRDEHLVDGNPEAAENQWPGIGGGGALRVEVDLLARQVRQRFDLRPDEDVQIRGKQVDDRDDTLLDLRDLQLVLFERVRVDDRQIHPLEIEKIVDVLGRAPCHDRKNMHLVAFIHHPRNLGSETDRGAFQQTAGKAYGPGIYLLPDLLFAGRRRRVQCPAGLRGTRIAERDRSDKYS